MTDKFSATILMVDDDRYILELLDTVVSAMDNYRTITTESGKESLEIVDRELPDLILLDIVLEDLDGIQVCRAIKGNEKTSHIPVIAITVVKKEQSERYQEIIDAGVDGYVEKPFTFSSLECIIRGFLKKR